MALTRILVPCPHCRKVLAIDSNGTVTWSMCGYLKVKSVGKPDALVPHVRFDERGWEK